MNSSLCTKPESRSDKKQSRQYGKMGAVVLVVLTLCLFVKVSFINSAPPDPAILISVAEAMSLKKTDSQTIFIDVRDEQAFEKMHIPDSIQIPLHFVRTKKYLQSVNAILVSDGYDYTALMATGAALNQQGYRIFVMAGGIASWHQRKGELTGDPLSKEELHRIPSSALLIMKKGNPHFIKTFINISQSKIDTPFPVVLHLPISKPDEIEKLLRVIAEQKLDEKSGILIFNQDGDYTHLSAILEDSPHTLFFLTGGFTAYKEYEQQQQAMLQPREDRLKKIGGCTTCPPVSDRNEK